MKRKSKSSPQAEMFGESASEPVIGDIQPLSTDPNLRRIKVGRRTVAILRSADVDSLRLKVGIVWAESLQARVDEIIQTDKARREAMRLLSKRPYSRQELIERLTKRGHSKDRAARMAAEMVRDGWLNERAYADDIVRGVTGTKPAGRRLIEEKLRKRGVPEAVVRQTLDAAGSQDDLAAALALGRRRFATISAAVTTDAALRRVGGLLARRGFDEEVVLTVVERLRSISESLPARQQ